MTWVFAGREDELERCAALTESFAHLAVFVPRGAGGSRFVAEFARAGAAGRRVHTLTAGRALGHIPFGALAPLLPPSAGDAPVASDGVARAIQAVARQVRHRPTTIVVDDAHHLDPLSIEVLLGLIDRSGSDLQVVVTIDPGRTLPGRLDEVWTSGAGATVELAPMSVEQFTAMLRSHDATISDERCDELHRWCAGLPLLAHERVMSDASDDHEAAADPRVIAAAERVLDLADEGERTIVEFLSFAGPTSRSLLSSSEPIVAGLERRSILTEHDHRVAIRIPLVEAAVAGTVGPRRRWALHSYMVARFRDALPASGPDLVALTLWDARGTRVLPVRETVRGARRALDDGAPDVARELLESVEQRRTPSSGLDVLLLEAELAATTDAEQSSRRLRAALRSAESRDDRDAVLTSTAAVFRRGALPADATSDLLAVAAAEATDAEMHRIDLLLAEMAWLRGDVDEAARLLSARPDREQDVSDRESRRMLQVATAVESARPETARSAVTTFRRTVRSSTSRAALIVDVGAGLGDILLEPLHAIDPPDDVERRLHPERWVARWAMAALARFVRGDLSGARTAALRARESTRASSRSSGGGLGSLAPVVARLADPELARPATTRRSPGARTEWCWWGRLFDAWLDLVAAPGDRTIARLERSVADASDAGASAVAAIGCHVLHRIGRSHPAWTILGSLRLDDSDSPVVRAVEAAITAARHVALDEQTAAASRLARLGWSAAAADEFGIVAAEGRQGGESWRNPLVAELAARRCGSNVDPRTLHRPSRTGSWMTPREHVVVWSIADGATSRQAAGRLQVSVRTVDNQLHRIYRRFGLDGRADLVACCERAAALADPLTSEPPVSRSQSPQPRR